MGPLGAIGVVALGALVGGFVASWVVNLRRIRREIAQVKLMHDAHVKAVALVVRRQARRTVGGYPSSTRLATELDPPRAIITGRPCPAGLADGSGCTLDGRHDGPHVWRRIR